MSFKYPKYFLCRFRLFNCAKSCKWGDRLPAVEDENRSKNFIKRQSYEQHQTESLKLFQDEENVKEKDIQVDNNNSNSLQTFSG